ncbi:MAG: hypothetical protein RLZZ519_1529, partial [Bacteroidota bacterium]
GRKPNTDLKTLRINATKTRAPLGQHRNAENASEAPNANTIATRKTKNPYLSTIDFPFSILNSPF